MGCDIHQINIMIDAKTKKPYSIDGEVPIGNVYHSEYIPEFIPGRFYDMFAILAGVRGEEFEINGSEHREIPEEISEEMKKDLNLRENAFHSFTWYFLNDLYRELKWTKKKIKMYAKAMSISNPDFISTGVIDEYRYKFKYVKGWIGYLEEVKQKLDKEGKGEDFSSSKIFFFFDS